ncbi:MAG: nucleoside hydrolase [Aureispira sp.]
MSKKAKRKVLFDHDGGIDDLLSLLLLLRMPDIELLGVTVTPADCYLEPAVQATAQILAKAGKAAVPIGVGTYYGENAFPSAWRAQPMFANALPSLIGIETPPSSQLPRATTLLIDQLQQADTKVTVLMTGPCSNLVLALEQAPELAHKIEQVVWMGGAVEVGGNVQAHWHDGSAEWNAYWAPQHTQTLLANNLPLVLISLDVTNQVPVDLDFLKKIARLPYEYAQLAGQLWASTVYTIPSYHATYYMWDVLATCYLGLENAFEVEEKQLLAAVSPPNAGEIYLADNGYTTRVAIGINKSVFYKYVIDLLSFDF